MVSALTCELASKSFFGDDVMVKSNVHRPDPVEKLERLDPAKLRQIRELVFKKSGSGLNEFEEMWAFAEKSLQTRMKNLRKNNVRMNTSSVLQNISDEHDNECD